MKALVLKRRLKLEKYEILMEIGRQARREEFHSVLVLAEERGGTVTAGDISKELLLGRPESMGKAVLDRCRDLDLLDDSGRITKIGREAIRTGSVFIPERARYAVWYTEDPLVPQKLIHLEAKDEPDLRDEVAGLKSDQAKNSKYEKAQPLPDKLRALEGGIFSLMGRGEGTITVRRMDMNGLTSTAGPEDDSSITLRLEPSGSHLAVSGRFERVLTPPPIAFDEAWVSALGNLAKHWARTRDPPALKSTFEELNERELMTFSKTVVLSQPSLANYGEFESTSVEEVPVVPERHVDAARWAKWLLKRSINTYLSGEECQKLVEKCRSKFPDFADIELPSSKDLARELSGEKTSDGRYPKEFWFLQAPLDLQVVGT